jgi:hypothetical protein
MYLLCRYCSISTIKLSVGGEDLVITPCRFSLATCLSKTVELDTSHGIVRYLSESVMLRWTRILSTSSSLLFQVFEPCTNCPICTGGPPKYLGGNSLNLQPSRGRTGFRHQVAASRLPHPNLPLSHDKSTNFTQCPPQRKPVRMRTRSPTRTCL